MLPNCPSADPCRSAPLLLQCVLIGSAAGSKCSASVRFRQYCAKVSWAGCSAGGRCRIACDCAQLTWSPVRPPACASPPSTTPPRPRPPPAAVQHCWDCLHPVLRAWALHLQRRLQPALQAVVSAGECPAAVRGAAPAAAAAATCCNRSALRRSHHCTLPSPSPAGLASAACHAPHGHAPGWT